MSHKRGPNFDRLDFHKRHPLLSRFLEVPEEVLGVRDDKKGRRRALSRDLLRL